MSDKQINLNIESEDQNSKNITLNFGPQHPALMVY